MKQKQKNTRPIAARYDFAAPFARAWDRLTGCGNSTRGYFFLLTVLLAFGFSCLLLPGIPLGHDIGFHLCRLAGLAEGFRNGLFPAWINVNSIGGMGYGTGFFYSDVFLYVPALLTAWGLPLITAYKFFLFTWGLLTAWSMFYAARRIGETPFGAFAAGLLYTWSSYFAVDIFNRAALGEIMAFLFLPWILLGLFRATHGRASQILPLALGFAGLLYAHTISFVLMSILAFLWCALHFTRFLRDVRRVAFLIAAGLLAAGVAAFGYVPMLEQMAHMKFNVTGQTMAVPIHPRAVPLTRLFLELPYMKLEYWIPPGIGLIFIVVLANRLRMRSTRSAEDCFRDGLLIAGLASLLAATNFLPWEGMLSVLSGIQFPWRFYLPATACLALGGGLLLGRLTADRTDARRYWAFVLLCGCGFAWFVNVGYTYAAKIHERQTIRTLTPEMFARSAVGGEHYLPQGVRLVALTAMEKIPRFRDGLEAERCILKRERYGDLTVRLENVRHAGSLELPLTPYYGYRAVATQGKSHDFSLDFSEKSFRVRIPEGYADGEFRVFYRNTRAQWFSLLISLASIVLAGIWWIVCQKKRNSEEPIR